MTAVPMPKTTREGYGISPEEFVVVWQRSRTVDEAVETLSKMAGRDVLRGTVVARAATYRRKGVRLKSMSGVPNRLLDRPTVERLNLIIAG